MSVESVNQQRPSSSPILPALVLGGGATAATKFLGPKKEMTQDVFERQVKAGSTIEYTGELNAQQKRVADSLKGLAEKADDAKGAKSAATESAGISKKELKGIFGKNDEVTASQFIKGRYHTTIDGMKGKITAESAKIKTDGELKSAVKTAQTEVDNAKKFQETLNEFFDVSKKITVAEKAKKSTKALTDKQIKLGEKLDGLTSKIDLEKYLSETGLEKKIAEQFEVYQKAAKKAKKTLSPEQLEKIEEKIMEKITLSETKKYAKTRLSNAEKALETANEALDKQIAKLAQMKADVSLVKEAETAAKATNKAAEKGAKKVKAMVSKTSVEEASSAVTGSVSSTKIANAFKVLKEHLGKVKPGWGIAAAVGGGVAVLTFLIGKSMSSSNKQA